MPDEGKKGGSLVDPIKRDDSRSAWSRPGGKVETVLPNHHRERIDRGWTASCSCNAETQPCTVLDCFAGSGTTLRVATRLGRKSIGIELSAAYVLDIIRKRTAQGGLGI